MAQYRKSARQPHIREPESSKIKDVQSAETDPCNMVSANSVSSLFFLPVCMTLEELYKESFLFLADGT